MRPPRSGLAAPVLLLAVALAGGLLAVEDPARQHPDHAFAPPMRPHIVDSAGQWRAPFVYPLVSVNRLAREYAIDRDRPTPLRWFADGRIVSAPVPWFPLGADSLGRDVFSRLVSGARLTLGVALTAAVLSLLAGAAVGGLAGSGGRGVDAVLMQLSDLVVTLPAIYVAVTLRAALPLVLTPAQTFWTMSAVLAAVGWPLAARGTRAIVATERASEYAEAARAAGAGRTRLLVRHLLPAAVPFLAGQATLLVPAFILAEATLSYLGLGFTDPAASWGSMLQALGAGSGLEDAPWLLAPAGAILLTVFVVHLAGARDSVH